MPKALKNLKVPARAPAAGITPFNKATPFKGGKILVTFNAADEEPAVIQIYEEIGEDPWTGAGFTAKDFADALADIPRNKPLDLRINCAGGSVWEGLTIKTLLDEWPARKTASIDGMAASVASWLPMSCDEIRAARHAQMFIHDAWAVVAGNEADLLDSAQKLGKTSAQIADIYARKTGMSSAECRGLMRANTLMTAEEAHEKGFIDVLVEVEPVANFTPAQIQNMTARLAVFNKLSTAPEGSAPQGITAPNQGGADNNNGPATEGSPNNKGSNVNRSAMVALLNKWGVKFDAKATDEELNKLIEAGKPGKTPKTANKIKFKEGDEGEHADDCDCADCAKGSNKAPEPGANKETDPSATENRLEKLLNLAEARERAATRALIENRVKNLVESDRLPAGQMKATIEAAMDAKDADAFLNILESLPERPPGVAPINVTSVDENTSPEDLDRVVNTLRKPMEYLVRNAARPNASELEMIGDNNRAIAATINRLKTYDHAGVLTGPIRAMWDRWAAQPMSSPRNANTMTTQLLRQVILSEIMRAFRRNFASLNIFAHTYQSVPLAGNDYVDVPYYPLDTVASSEFTYAAGYVVTPNAQTLAKQIFVGGIGNGVATAGSGRKYKGLQFTAYEVRRQPWLNIAQLTVMAGEQLAIDVRADILGTQVCAANFGNAIWSGAAGGFDETVMAQYLQNAAIKAMWPLGSRNCVLAPDYYTNLAASPYVKAFLNIGSTDTIREGKIGGLYGFQDTIYDPVMPVANFIRGGDGAVTNGNDPYLAGFIAYPSAVLIATAPIMPPPGVLKKLVAYEQVVDDQTGLAFTYQYFGLELNNVDNEIIECTYGSNPGELAALKRLTSQGN